MTALRTQLEDAVVAVLVPLKKVGLGGGASGYLGTVEVYQGPLDPEPDEPALQHVLEGRTPAVLVTTGDGEYSDLTEGRRPSADNDLTVEILVVSSNMRSHAAKARGDVATNDPGIYQILEDVRDLLFGVDVGVAGAGKLWPQREAAVVRAGARAIWRMTFAIGTDAIAADPDAAAGDYTELEVQGNNPDDAAADPVVTTRDAIP